MAYTKKSYKKRTWYRKKKFTKYNLYKHRTSKNQAYQIYNLNKKINNIEKKTKPETITKECVLLNRLFTTDGELGSYGLKEWHGRCYLYEEKLFAEDGCNYDLKGNMLRPYNITISGIFENKNHNVEIGGKIYVPPLTGYMRFIVCKLYGGNQGRYPEQITKPYGLETEPDIGLIMGPLKDDISASLKIVKNKVIKIDNNHDNRMFKIKIKNPGTYRKGLDGGGTEPAYKNEYLIYYQYFCPVQHFADGYTGQEPVAPIQRITSGIKFAFVDEN